MLYVIAHERIRTVCSTKYMRLANCLMDYTFCRVHYTKGLYVETKMPKDLKHTRSRESAFDTRFVI